MHEWLPVQRGIGRFFMQSQSSLLLAGPVMKVSGKQKLMGQHFSNMSQYRLHHDLLRPTVVSQ